MKICQAKGLPTYAPTGKPTLAPVTKSPTACKNLYLYNQTLCPENKAKCVKKDLNCDWKTTACDGNVACNGVAPAAAGAGPMCCAVNTCKGLGNCDGTSEGLKEYYVEDGSACNFKAKQSKLSYFNVCKSDACTPTSTPTRKPTTATPTRTPTLPTCTGTQLNVCGCNHDDKIFGLEGEKESLETVTACGCTCPGSRRSLRATA
jgi:hypothetical protein